MNSIKKMRQIHKLSLSAFSLLAIPIAFAVDTHYGDIVGDLYFPNGVLLEDTTSPSEGDAEVDLGGDGSLTIGNQAGPGGFPRLTVVGGVNIKSKRDFPPEETNITTWDGQFSAPGSTIKPTQSEITFEGGHQVSEVEVLDAFNWGLSNETFTFSPEARVMLPVDAQDGQKAWIAYEGSDTWTANDDDFCIIEGGLCYTEVGSVNKLAVVKKLYESCPRSSVSNGELSSAPNCIITCDSGYELNGNADACIEASSDGGVGMETTGEEEAFAPTESGDDGLAFIVPEKEYDFPPGHFRYRASIDNFYRYLDESALEEGDLETAKHVNTTYISRNPRTADEQIKAREAANAETKVENEESFITYLIQMRNRFGENAQENHYTALSGGESGEKTASEDGESTAEVAGGDEEDSGEYHSSGGMMLPSTGPGVFLTIALVGIGLMLFGVRRS